MTVPVMAGTPPRNESCSTMANKSCALCGGSSLTVYLEKDKYQIRKCSACSLVYLNHEFKEGGLSEFYSVDYFQTGSDGRGYEDYEACERFLTLNFMRRIKRVSTYVTAGNVLDLGCGYGFFLRCLGENYEGVGLDVSNHAVRVAREKYGVNAQAGLLERNSFPPNYFSLITLWDVLEHLPDPKETFEILRSIMKDDGVMVLTTGNVDSIAAKLWGKRWHLYTVPEHLWFFSPHTLANLLNQTGFRVVEMHSDWCFYSIDYLIERLLKTLFEARWAVSLIPFKTAAKKILIPFSLFDITYCLCRKA
jgi:2-polyprenyl-3-methyl-5-hydroxy-6-metoxy-1,4-benzoquinol methylase